MFSPSCAFAGSRPAFVLRLPPFRLFHLLSHDLAFADSTVGATLRCRRLLASRLAVN
jgi:hypothetical protein